MNWQEYHFKYFKNYFETVGTLTCPRVLDFEPIGDLKSKCPQKRRIRAHVGQDVSSRFSIQTNILTQSQE